MGFHSFLEKGHLSQHKHFFVVVVVRFVKFLLVFHGLFGCSNNEILVAVLLVETSARGLESCQGCLFVNIMSTPEQLLDPLLLNTGHREVLNLEHTPSLVNDA
jgi:hypothetical protein